MSGENKLQAKTKFNKKLLVGAIAVIVIALVAALIIFLPKSAQASKITEQLNLGDKYLSELNYEQAVVSYLAVIEIDPKNVDAYLGLADAYIAQGKYDMAINVLEDALAELGDDAVGAEAIEEKLAEAEEAKKLSEDAVEVTPTPVPTPTTAPTATPTPMSTNTPTPMPEPTATSTPAPTATSTPAPTVSSEPTETPQATATPVPTATSTPTPKPTATPTAEGGIRVELSLASDGFTYGIYEDTYVCTGLSEKGYAEFEKYDSASLVSIKLPGISDTGETVYGFHSGSDAGYDLADMLTKESAYVELVCAESYTVYYGVKWNNCKYLEKLMSVVLNAGLREIGSAAFEACTGLKEINLENVRTYGANAFRGCSNLVIESLEIGDGTFERNVFSGVTIKKLVMSNDNVIATEEYAQYGSFNGADIGEVEIKEGVSRIPEHTFKGCSSITRIVLPSSVKEVGDSAFEACSGLKEINLENVHIYGANVFKGCDNLVIESLEIGDGTFERNVFSRVTIKKLVMSNDNVIATEEYAQYGSFNGADIGEVEIKEGVSRIPEHTFKGCNSIARIVLPSSVKEVGDSAFEACTGLQTVEVPDSVEVIEQSAFRNCSNITIITPAGSYAEIYAVENEIPVENQ